MRTLLKTLLLVALAISPALAVVDVEVCATPGQQGAGGTLTGTINTYYPGLAGVAAGATTITLGPSTGSATQIAAGNLLIVMQMQDADIDSTNTGAYGDGVAGDPARGSTNLSTTSTAGKYEYVEAVSFVAGVVTILGKGAGGGLLNSYTAAVPGAQGVRTFQVIRVPQFDSATLSSTLTALAWSFAIDVRWLSRQYRTCRRP